jgi:hypothetical protein
LLKASIPNGSGTLVHNVGALPSIAFVVVLILYKFAKVVTAVLFVNVKQEVNCLQFLKHDAKLITFGQLSNKLDGYEFKELHPLKVDEKIVACELLLNNPFGIDVIFVKEKASVKVVAFTA